MCVADGMFLQVLLMYYLLRVTLPAHECLNTLLRKPIDDGSSSYSSRSYESLGIKTILCSFSNPKLSLYLMSFKSVQWFRPKT